MSANKPTSTVARLKKLREKFGLSQRDLAKELGVTPGAVALWEMGERQLSGPVVRLIELYESGIVPLKKEVACE